MTTTPTVSYYELLGVDRDATPDEVRKSFRSLSRIYHPDQNPSAAAAAMYRRLTEALEVLTDDVKRADYNRTVDQPAAEPTPEAVPEPPAPDPVWEGEETVDLDDDLEDPVDIDDESLNFDVVDDSTPDSTEWAKAPTAGALPSTPGQRRVWWRLTGVSALALLGVLGYAMVASQTVRVPTGVSSWAGGATFMGFWGTVAAVYAIFCRAGRRIVLWALALSTVISLIVGWNAWALGQGYVYLPLNPAGVSLAAFVLAITGRRAWRMHKGRHLTLDAEDAEDAEDGA